jgi:gephyrin
VSPCARAGQSMSIYLSFRVFGTSRLMVGLLYLQLASPIGLDSRTEFHRVAIRADAEGLRAFSTGGQRSSRVASLSGANGFLVLPMRTPERGRLEEGTVVPAVLIGDILNF